MTYLQAENLKHKRTFTKKLMILAPFVVILMNVLAPLWFQINSYNWWYIFLYPGFLTLICGLVEQRDGGKLNYQSVFSIPVSPDKVWKAKIGIAGIYSFVGNLIFLILNLAGGFVLLAISGLELRISIWQAAAGTMCIALASLWEIPLCLWLSKKAGIFVTVILNAGIGSILGIFAANTSFWSICPYSWVPHLMIFLLGIMPNGEPVTKSGAPMPYLTIMVILFISFILFAVLSCWTGKRFEKQEVG